MLVPIKPPYSKQLLILKRLNTACLIFASMFFVPCSTIAGIKYYIWIITKTNLQGFCMTIQEKFW